MAYSELIKNFNRIRDYMREFYVYGFKTRDEYTKKSARSYDDERRRLESWLGDYMQFRRNADGKNVFLSVDSRVSRRNPLYKAWKTKSFTDGDITLHFLLFDILADTKEKLTLAEIIDRMDGYLSQFSNPRMFDESTVRKKLKEYTEEGIVVSHKAGKTMVYSRAPVCDLPDMDAVEFFSEIAPCGVIGSFLLDKAEHTDDYFAFKHHYITGAMDSGILCDLFTAMREKREVTLTYIRRQQDRTTEKPVVPLKIMISVQNGRQYLMAYAPYFDRITAYRTDHIVSVKTGKESEHFEKLRSDLERMLPHMWGVSTQAGNKSRMEHVTFTIRYEEDEMYIPGRLEREKRCGTVEHFENHTSRFTADVYDAHELIPWIRTFICRITSISFSDKELEEQFKKDLADMYAMYTSEGGDRDALQ